MDRVDLTHEFGVDRQRAWRDRPTAASNMRLLALRLAYRWMREAGGRWWPTPAAYDNREEPVDGLPWVRRGGEWHLED